MSLTSYRAAPPRECRFAIADSMLISKQITVNVVSITYLALLGRSAPHLGKPQVFPCWRRPRYARPPVDPFPKEVAVIFSSLRKNYILREKTAFST